MVIFCDLSCSHDCTYSHSDDSLVHTTVPHANFAHALAHARPTIVPLFSNYNEANVMHGWGGGGGGGVIGCPQPYVMYI